MPRPRKCRKVCQMPMTKEFRPAGVLPCKSAVILTVDEYEAIRLIDKQGLSQEECSAYLQVARTTAQLICNSARKKLADALVNGLTLRIEGGSYQLCNGNEECGHLVMGIKAPEVCPVCAHPQAFFEVRAENY